MERCLWISKEAMKGEILLGSSGEMGPMGL
jgi:hypothetical protein